jgi:hypothetical protein
MGFIRNLWKREGLEKYLGISSVVGMNTSSAGVSRDYGAGSLEVEVADSLVSEREGVVGKGNDYDGDRGDVGGKGEVKKKVSDPYGLKLIGAGLVGAYIGLIGFFSGVDVVRNESFRQKTVLSFPSKQEVVDELNHRGIPKEHFKGLDVFLGDSYFCFSKEAVANSGGKRIIVSPTINFSSDRIVTAINEELCHNLFLYLDESKKLLFAENSEFLIKKYSDIYAVSDIKGKYELNKLFGAYFGRRLSGVNHPVPDFENFEEDLTNFYNLYYSENSLKSPLADMFKKDLDYFFKDLFEVEFSTEIPPDLIQEIGYSTFVRFWFSNLKFIPLQSYNFLKTYLSEKF